LETTKRLGDEAFALALIQRSAKRVSCRAMAPGG
jgi:hypothetical protein